MAKLPTDPLLIVKKYYSLLRIPSLKRTKAIGLVLDFQSITFQRMPKEQNKVNITPLFPLQIPMFIVTLAVMSFVMLSTSA